jgi:GAF domain-containing protein
VVRGERLVHLTDRREEEAYRDDPVFRGLVDTSGVRASVSVALRKDETLLGMINVYRQEVRSFTEKQIALLENFAAQAVIAMENARLITEAREALEQQTAAAEVLQVINSSPGDLAPVFEAILDKAHTLCGAALGSLFLYDGELFHAAATYGYPEDLAQRLRQGIVLFSTPQLLDDSVRWVHNPDLTLLDNPTARAVSGRGGVRTSLILPLRKDGRLLGAISCNRREVRPFADKQIALLQNFAAQAVIAMENARRLTETREALEQQTATAEVLQIINSSPGDLAPVFDAILEKAHTLCEAEKGSLNTYDGEHFQAVATHGLSPEYAAMLRAPQSKPPGSPPDRLLRGETIVQVLDASVLPFPIAQAATAIESVRTILYVPLRKETALLGYITVYRQEVRPFAEKQIALLQNFAAQAVIAMENARLLGELHQRTDEIAVEPRVRGAGSGAGRRVGPGRKIETVPCTATRRTDRLAGR